MDSSQILSSIQAQKKLEEGRWSKEEHARFIEGIKKYNKNWKKVEEHVQTRSGAQIRSHAQKFFNRLEKEMEKKKLTQEMAIDLENEKVLSIILNKKKEKINSKANSKKDKEKENNNPLQMSDYEDSNQNYFDQSQYNMKPLIDNLIQQQNQLLNPLNFQMMQYQMLQYYNLMKRQQQNFVFYPNLFSSPDKFKGIESQVLEKFEMYKQQQQFLQQQRILQENFNLLSQNNINNTNNINNQFFNNQSKKLGSFTVVPSQNTQKQIVKVQNFKRKVSHSFNQLDDLESVSNTNTNTNTPICDESMLNKKVKMYL